LHRRPWLVFLVLSLVACGRRTDQRGAADTAMVCARSSRLRFYAGGV